jgi:endonuclease/exonuclease/phosphatase family metal-dependent hydrolase
MFKALYRVAVLITLAIYALYYSPWPIHWGTHFVLLSIPGWLCFHGLVLLLSLFGRWRIGWLALLVTLAGVPFWRSTFQVSADSDSVFMPDPGSLTIVNYNVKNFDHYTYSRVGSDVPERLLDWLVATQADVLCLQEVQDLGKAPFNATQRLREAGYRHTATFDQKARPSGLVVYAKHPIVGVDNAYFGGQNGLVSADMVWQTDTLRIINVHLHSMTLRFEGLRKSQDMAQTKAALREIARKMKKGYEERTEQAALLSEWIAASPYPVIVCGDFNETPYSYVYRMLQKQLSNAYEEKGRGFGFTFRSAPYWIRIDHQFYDPNRLNLVAFKTHREITLSDHYPLRATYSMKN